MAEKKCDNCGEKTRVKYLGKIRGKMLCKKCQRKLIKNRREETIEKSGIRNELRELKNKNHREKGYSKKAYAKKVGRKVRIYTKRDQENPPIPKGSTSGKIKQKYKSESYLTFHEKQALLRMLVKRGVDFEGAKERIKELVKSQRKLREKLKQQNKPDKEIKLKQQKLLEELYNY